MKEFWSLKEVADYLDVEYKTVYRLVRKGEIPAGKVGGIYRVRKEDLDAYFERQKVAVPVSAREPQGAAPNQLLKCAVCLRLLTDETQVAGRCTHDRCDLPICHRCWNVDGARHCLTHRPSATDQLARARERLAAGEIPVLITAVQAKQREITFLSRFERKVSEITALRHPLDGRVLRVNWSWTEVHVQSDESVRVMELLRTGFLDRETERKMPLNRCSRYTLPEVAKPGLMLAAHSVSHLPALVREGFDTRPASLAELLHLLEQSIDLAEDADAIYAVGIGATSGWAREAVNYIRPDGKGQSFSHRLVLPVLVDLHSGGLVYDELDRRLAPLVSLFQPRLSTEQVAAVATHIQKELRSSSAVPLEEVREAMGVSPEVVQDAFKQLVSNGGYQLDDIEGIGVVLSPRT